MPPLNLEAELHKIMKTSWEDWKKSEGLDDSKKAAWEDFMLFQGAAEEARFLLKAGIITKEEMMACFEPINKQIREYDRIFLENSGENRNTPEAEPGSP